MFKTLRKEIGHDGNIPQGWKLAWYEPRRHVGVYYPPPLHWIARFLLELRYRLRLAIRAPRLEGAEFFAIQRNHRQQQRLADEYSKGYMTGWRECYQACIDAIQDEMKQGEDVWDVGILLTNGKTAGHQN